VKLTLTPIGHTTTMADEDDDEHYGDVDIQTAAEILTMGLLAKGFSEERLGKNNTDRKYEWFQSAFGCSPVVVARMWTDLQTTEVEEARVDAKEGSIKDFLNTLDWLKSYQSETQREGPTGLSSKTLRKRCWSYCRKLQALKAEKIFFPLDYPDDTIWIMTVDGTHFAVNEPRHAEFSQDKKHFSHKKGRAGWSYELGICLYSSNLIWMNGPFPAGQNDKTIFAKPEGLKDKLKTLGLKAIGDKFYNGHLDEVSIFNRMDSPEVKKFKGRALLRHESFNSLLKHFAILDDRFRHVGRESFATCFEAVAVICQYRIELECPLYDI
jgi:DDE superfamily endonuclease